MKCPECGYYQVKSYYAKLEEQNARFLKNFLGNDDIISFEGDYMSIEIICREVSRIMRKYDEPDPWKLAEAMGIIVQVMPLAVQRNRVKGSFCDNQEKSTSP